MTSDPTPSVPLGYGARVIPGPAAVQQGFKPTVRTLHTTRRRRGPCRVCRAPIEPGALYCAKEPSSPLCARCVVLVSEGEA